MLIDTHTHLFSEAFNEDRSEVVQRAIDAGVRYLLLPNIDARSIGAMHQLVEQFPSHCFPMMGLHPGSVGEDWERQLEEVEKHLFSGNYVAVGEIGMDLYWDTTFVEQQRIVFRKQVEWAKQLRLPIAIHAREAFEPIFEILDELNDATLTGVFHCFTGSSAQAQHIASYGGFKLGIGGVVTYKKAGLDEVLQTIPLNQLILETDSPYLPPVPFRGKRNESSYLLHVAERVADIYGTTLQHVAQETTANAITLFKLSQTHQS